MKTYLLRYRNKAEGYIDYQIFDAKDDDDAITWSQYLLELILENDGQRCEIEAIYEIVKRVC